MITSVESPVTPSALRGESDDDHFVFHDVDWQFYELLLDNLGDRPVFATYDHGELELMSPGWKHDNRGRTLGYMIRVLGEEMKVPMQGGGSVTLKLKEKNIGLEPDECFYTKNIQSVFGIDRVDLNHQPAPDLVIEVEISRRSSDRIRIYAALGASELWRFDGRSIRISVLNDRQKYVPVDRSPTFPAVPIDQLSAQLERSAVSDWSTWGTDFRRWAQELARKTSQ